MTQYDFGSLNRDVAYGMTVIADAMERMRDALHTMHAGAERPSYAVAGFWWLKNTTTPWEIYIYDGVQDLCVFYVNPTTHSITLAFEVLPQATETTQGRVELATLIETIAGTDTARAVTPAGVKAHVDTDQKTRGPISQLSLQNKAPYYDYTNASFMVRDGTVTGKHYHEPKICQGRNGVLHLTYVRSLEHGITSGWEVIYCRSWDGGKTWEDERALVPTDPLKAYDPAGIVCTPTGRLIITYNDLSHDNSVNTAPSIYKAIYSDDDGETWSDAVAIDTINYSYARLFGRTKIIPSSEEGQNYRIVQTAYHKKSDTPTYQIVLYFSDDDGLTWSDLVEVQETSKNESECVFINADIGFLVSRGGTLTQYKTTDGGATWTEQGAISGTSDTSVAPSLDKFCHNGIWYLYLGYCHRSSDQDIRKIIPVSEALAGASGWRDTKVLNSDVVGSGGYQSVVTKMDGTLQFDEGVGSVYMTEYTGQTYSSLRFTRSNLFDHFVPTFTAGARFGSGVGALDYYQEGDWTPVPYGSTTAGSPTGTFRGRYTRVGNVVHVSCQIVFTNLGGMAGNFRVGGLPFETSNEPVKRGAPIIGLKSNFTTDYDISGYTQDSNTYINFLKADGDFTNVPVTDLSNTANLYFNMTYLLY